MHNMNTNSFSTPTLLHAVRAVMMMDLDIFADILQPCGSTPWASAANPAKFLPAQHRTGVLSTTGAAKAAAGFPLGSVVEYGVDSQGRPVFALSSLSGHTRDIRSDPRCSLTVTSPGFQVAMRKHMYPKQDPRYQMYTRACAKQTARLTALAPWEGVIHWAERCSLPQVSDGVFDGALRHMSMLGTAQGMSDARFTLVGRVLPVSEQEEAAAREAYMSKNPGSFWVS